MVFFDRAVDAVPLILGVLTKPFEQTLPDTLACPAVEAIEHGLPGTKVVGKISPRRARTPPPQDRFHAVAITASTRLRSSRPGRAGAFPHAQCCFDPLPLTGTGKRERSQVRGAPYPATTPSTLEEMRITELQYKPVDYGTLAAAPARVLPRRLG
jgi:hypothetical protein